MPFSADLVDCDWLGKQMKDQVASVKVFDCHYKPQPKPDLASYPFGKWTELEARDTPARREFELVHLPGAQHADVDVYMRPTATARRDLYNADQFQEWLQSKGVNADDHLVLYDRTALMLFASRFWSVLQHFGHSKVSILNGGFTEWNKRSLSVTSDMVKPQKGNWRAQPASPPLLIDTAQLLTVAKANKPIFDGRPPAAFNGEDKQFFEKAKGTRLPNSTNIPIAQFFDDNLLKPKDELAKLVGDTKTGDGFVTVCNFGIQASVLQFVLCLASDNQRSGLLHNTGLTEVAAVEPDALA